MRVLPVFEPGERVVVALSGGADSVALLLCLMDQPDLILTAAHLNHAIRGQAALRDQQFARQLCAQLGVPLIEDCMDVPALAAARREGLETAARRIRRAFLMEALEGAGATVIATAHHAVDQAETVLMHLCRGGGVHGAAGMRARTGVWAKPLLHTTKRELLSFLDERHQTHCEDETNRICDTPRNAIRQHVLPALETIYPDAARKLARYAALAADEDDYLAGETSAFLTSYAQPMPFGARLQKTQAHPALLRRALVALTGADYEAVHAMESLYVDARGAFEAGRWRAERTGTYLYLIDRSIRPPNSEVALNDGAVLPGIGQMTLAPSAAQIIRDDRTTQVLSATALEGAVVRTRRAGDRMRPLGAPGDRLLSDVMIDRKMDRPLRDYWPVVAKGNRILCLIGACIAQEAAISKDTAGAVRLAWIREDHQWNRAN